MTEKTPVFLKVQGYTGKYHRVSLLVKLVAVTTRLVLLCMAYGFMPHA